MAITKILNIQESDGRNPASHLKNALEYIQNPDKTEECVLVGSINCLPDTAFEQMEETKNIFHKTGKRQGYHVIISFSPEEKVTAEQAMYVLEHFAKDVLSDDYEAVYAVHTDREHMHGHLIWNSVSITTGKKYNSPKSNWKNHLQPITNKYCDELGLAIMPAEYSRNPKNISRDKWEREMSMKEIILRDAKMCAYAAGNVEHFKYLMKRLGYVFKKDAWMEVQAPGFRYYHKLAKMDEMFSEDMLRHHVDMPWMAKPYFYSSDIRGLHRAKLSPFQKKAYNGKCAYCGASIDLIKKTEFEIDHFLYEKAPIFATKKDAGYMGNLILSCHDCNHNKNSFWIEKEEMDTLNPDGEKIKNVFIRDDKYYIRINDEFKKNTTIEGFYNKLCLGSELHRLDYLIMNIIGLQRYCEDNSDLYVGLGKILDIIRKKRNIM